jgi:murein DD-endopeptidase MepM/ murein hydrolase activator NlpD
VRVRLRLFHLIPLAGALLALAACSRPVDPALFEEVTTSPGVSVLVTVTRRPDAAGSQQQRVPPADPAGTPPAGFPTRAPLPGSPTPDPPRGLTPLPQVEQYTVAWGDTLATIAARFGTTIDTLIALNDLANPDQLVAGTTLRVPVQSDLAGPPGKLIPDSELVYGPAARDFDVAAFAGAYGGYLANYSEEVEGELRSGPAIVQLAAQRFSVNPRLLLALLELRSGWLTSPAPAETIFPLGSRDPARAGLYNQLAWASDQLNAGFYGWRERDLVTARLSDARALLAEGLNPGTAGLQYYLAQENDRAAWEGEVGPAGFAAVYARLYGDPFAYAVEPLAPEGIAQPALELPWAPGETWYLTGGPHGGWGDGGAWAALDFVSPRSPLGCDPAPEWVTASAAGLIVRAGDGQVVIDLDGDGFEGTGWTLHYSHLAADGRVTAGQTVAAGDPLGHPSCEGGYSNATHVHFARRYNGLWISAAGRLPFALSGWVAEGSEQVYDGALVRGDEVRYACECKELPYNGVAR